jgi:hypothetical protein
MTAKEARRQYAAAYMREYRRKNKEKVAETNRRYWERKAAKLTAEQAKQKEVDSNDTDKQ